ncbi:unnamed protein product [Bursaphelenchus okinawaensis]|uniref:Alpha-mannosidase n=1 Tax=Bursaphelenchus okinawaensis TaxID=465554 RepID=A0A811KYW2_9BILA|nr:unnamed protein product [Bursaphelenchus okinawaensis]CAG9114801.1 unnamed protein product [Bursaphelenchus okinawaensis]
MKSWVNVLFIAAVVIYFWFYLLSNRIDVNSVPKYLKTFARIDKPVTDDDETLPIETTDYSNSSNCFRPETNADIKIDGQSLLISKEYKPPPKDEILNVHLVFHSHLDPGWLLTFKEYYDEQVSLIFDNMIDYLSTHPDGRFIWSEMSFLHHFWINSSSKKREKVREFIKNGQLELCGAAWVMTDEATPYFWATIDNIVEGQRFVYDTFGYAANTSWSVDPFGHGSMNPYLMSLAGIKSMVVGRLNQNVKIKMRKQQAMIFKWTQPWQQGQEPQIPTVMSLPDVYYTTTNGCGPDGQVCCKFEWGTSSRSLCAERIFITDENVENRSAMLTEQYKTYHNFYNGDALLVSIGDDFYFRSKDDFSLMYDNYKKIIDHVNVNVDKYKVRMQFSTPAVLRGNFFPYTEDKDGNSSFWTGYFVHRSNFKQLERKAQANLRRIDLLRSRLGVTSNYDELTAHRRNVSLVQHHDSITGTSKVHVMKDYRNRLLEAATYFAEQEASLLGGSSTHDVHDDGQMIELGKDKPKKTVVIFNQNTETTEKKIVLTVSTQYVKVKNSEYIPIQAQIIPGIDKASLDVNMEFFELVFYLKMDALSTKEFSLIYTGKKQKIEEVAMSEMTDMNLFEKYKIKTNFFDLNVINGSIDGITHKDGSIETFSINYGHYTDRGGAYVFDPVSDFLEAYKTKCTRFDGPIVARIYCQVFLQLREKHFYVITELVEVYKKQKENMVEVNVDVFSQLKELKAQTLIMNVASKIRPKNVLWTDVNGLYLTNHEVNGSLPISANYFPAPTESMIQDKRRRLTLLARQSTGATLDDNGNLNVMVDRSVLGDDGKGLGFADARTDHPSHFKSKIIIETLKSPPKSTTFQSKAIDNILEDLLHPVSIIEESKANISIDSVYWPCSVQLINLRQVNDFYLLTMRRLEYDCHVEHDKDCDIDWKKLDITINSLLPKKPKSIVFTSLTGIHDGDTYKIELLKQKLMPFEIVTMKLVK